MKYYKIGYYDRDNSLGDRVTVEAPTAIAAAKLFLKRQVDNRVPKRSGDTDVQLSVRETVHENGKDYYTGNSNWYKLI